MEVYCNTPGTQEGLFTGLSCLILMRKYEVLISTTATTPALQIRNLRVQTNLVKIQLQVAQLGFKNNLWFPQNTS